MDSGRQITFNRYVTRLVFGKSPGSCRNVKKTSNLDSGGRITFRRHITTWVSDSWYTDFIQRHLGAGTHFQYLINVPLPLKEVGGCLRQPTVSLGVATANSHGSRHFQWWQGVWHARVPNSLFRTHCQKGVGVAKVRKPCNWPLGCPRDFLMRSRDSHSHKGKKPQKPTDFFFLARNSPTKRTF